MSLSTIVDSYSSSTSARIASRADRRHWVLTISECRHQHIDSLVASTVDTAVTASDDDVPMMSLEEASRFLINTGAEASTVASNNYTPAPLSALNDPTMTLEICNTALDKFDWRGIDAEACEDIYIEQRNDQTSLLARMDSDIGRARRIQMSMANRDFSDMRAPYNRSSHIRLVRSFVNTFDTFSPPSTRSVVFKAVGGHWVEMSKAGCKEVVFWPAMASAITIFKMDALYGRCYPPLCEIRQYWYYQYAMLPPFPKPTTSAVGTRPRPGRSVCF